MVREQGRTVGVTSDGGEEDAKIANAVSFDVSKEAETDDSWDVLASHLGDSTGRELCNTNGCVEDDNGTPNVPFITIVRLNHHYYRSGTVGWRNEALCFCDVEAHSVAENNWENCVEASVSIRGLYLVKKTGTTE